MKKLFSCGIVMFAGLLTATVFASPSITFFTTLNQAEQYCPAVDALTFTAVNPSIPNSKGTIAGNKNSVTFKNYGDYAAAPQNAQEGVIQGVQFRKVTVGSISYYGYSSGNTITCLYIYPVFTGNLFNLVMQGSN